MKDTRLEITGLAEGWIRGRIKGPHSALVMELENAIQPKLRSYDEKTKTIAVDPSVFDVLVDTAMKSGAQVFMRETTDDLGPEEEPEEDDEPWSAFLQLASNDVLKQIHKMMIVALHPDRRGGNEEKMKKLNIYWDKIRKERRIK